MTTFVCRGTLFFVVSMIAAILIYIYFSGLLFMSSQSFNHFFINVTDPSTTVSGNCKTGEVRFVDFTDNPEEDSRQGTIQICINDAWGFICGDDYFDDTDASVFCGQLRGFASTGKIFLFDRNVFKCIMIAGATHIEATAVSESLVPIFLSAMDCMETDKSLLEDCHHDEVGLATCDDDLILAVVKCFGRHIIFS